MENNKRLNSKIIRSIFVYETKRITLEGLVRMGMFVLSLTCIFVLGSVIIDVTTESEMGGLLNEFFKAKEYSLSRVSELWGVISGELPQWLVVSYIVGLGVGCILIVSIVRNRKSIVHKVRSIIAYWFKL